MPKRSAVAHSGGMSWTITLVTGQLRPQHHHHDRKQQDGVRPETGAGCPMHWRVARCRPYQRCGGLSRGPCRIAVAGSTGPFASKQRHRRATSEPGEARGDIGRQLGEVGPGHAVGLAGAGSIAVAGAQVLRRHRRRGPRLEPGGGVLLPATLGGAWQPRGSGGGPGRGRGGLRRAVAAGGRQRVARREPAGRWRRPAWVAAGWAAV